MKKITLLLLSGLLTTAMCSLATVLCSFAESRVGAESPNRGTSKVAVEIENFSFGSGTVRVPVGTTVEWTNRDDIPHTVVSTDGLFKSDALDTDDSFSHRFDRAGVYDYFCSLHPKMTGKVVVK